MVNAVRSIEARVLANGAKMPTRGLGLWKMPKATCADSVFGAI